MAQSSVAAPLGVEETKAGKAPPVARRWALTPQRQRELLLALLLLLCYGFFHQSTGWNEESRADLVLALVDHHTTRIDPYQADTGDKLLYQNHYYSDKGPGGALVGIPTYVLMRGFNAVTGQQPPDMAANILGLTYTVSGFSTVLLVILLVRALRPITGESWALLLGAGYGLGTIAWPFATLYFEHAPSALFLFAAFFLLWQHALDEQRQLAWRPLLAGVLAGWGVLTEYPTAIGVGVLFFFVLTRSRRDALLFVAGGIPELAILGLFNWGNFGNPFELGYRYDVSFGTFHQQGFEGVGFPKLKVLGDLLFSPYGLLRLSPWLVLTPLGAWGLRDRRWRGGVVTCLAVVAVFLLYNSGYYNPFGGRTPGPRFLLPALPFAVVLVACVPRLFRLSAGFLIALSILLCLIATSTLPEVPEAVQNPMADQWWPQFSIGDLATSTAWFRWGLAGLQPIGVLILAALITVLALSTSALRGRFWRWPTRALAAVLALLVVTLGTPLVWPGQPDLGVALAGNPSGIVILSAAVTPVIWKDQPSKVQPWAEIDNHGPALAHSTDSWSIYDASGKRVFWASHGDMSWGAGERRRLNIEWTTQGVTPGIYHVVLAITSTDQTVTLATDADAGTFPVGS